MIGYIYMFLTALCWSLAGVCIRFNSQTAIMIAAVNGVIGLILNSVINKQRILINKTIIIGAIAQFMMGMIFTFANQLTTVGNAIILQYTSMIFVLIYQTFDTKKLPSLQQIAVVLIVIIGMVIFFFESLSFKGMVGNIISIISGAFYGLQFYVNTKKDANPVSSMLLAFIMNTSLLLFVLKDIPSITMSEWGVMLVQGIVCAGLGSYFFSKGIPLVHPLSANVICMLEIILSPLWALFIFNERMSSYAIIGAVIMVVRIIFNLYIENKKMIIKKFFTHTYSSNNKF